MPDIFTKERRSEIMSRISGQNTKPEIVVRKLLHSMGFRFRLHDARLQGRPDVVLPRHKKLIFVHGCFWHGHRGCKRAKLPTTNVNFWKKKISGNMVRDKKNIKTLKAQGWKVLVIWSCEISKIGMLKKNLGRFMNNGA